MKFSNSQLLLLHAAVAAADTSYNGSWPPLVYLQSGPITGVAVNLPGALGPVNKFLGIPYADKPIRFALPRPSIKWSAPKDTTSFGNPCYQLAVRDPIGYPNPRGYANRVATNQASADLSSGQQLYDYLSGSRSDMSEDCLFINAFAPATTVPVGGRPILFFIHGGGWTVGSGNADLSGFAAYEDIVVFTFNYRLNIFGFPNGHDIPLQGRNLGLYDQHIALQWVRDNAHAFGGNPSKITIWGFSAGSTSVDLFMHVYAHAVEPPFRGAIMTSGEFSFGRIGSFIRDANDTAEWDSVAKAANCSGSTVECLRKLSADNLLKLVIEQGNLDFLPVADNRSVPLARASAWRRGNVVKVPILGGTSAEEGRSLVSLDVSIDEFNDAYFPETLVNKTQLESIYTYYKTLPDTDSNFEVASKIYNDLFLQCVSKSILLPMMRLTSAASNYMPTWRYYNNISMTEFLKPGDRYIGKYHGSDIMSLFLSTTYDGVTPDGTPFPAVKSAYLKYWRGVLGRFVRNPKAGPGWPEVGSSQYAPLYLATLGDVGNTHSAGSTPVNQREVDVNCDALREVLDVIETMTG
ncbi:hypothetical protein E4U43_000473 [Claviceps pusilla]|uniref:Carboxylic ester hydrolase n=1 Tax=Claviceps pusilla TaxID=123648 RepID=A0A9P7NBW1_9HYPO|nr:hypothetical protein E4U43_000473 [Claviceps pusilla]